jgi:hypothetical protein
MMARPGKLMARFMLPAVIIVAAAAMMRNGIGCAWSQSNSPAPALGLQEQPQRTPAQQGEPASSSPRPENPGLISEIKRLFEKSLSVLPPLKSPGETIDDLNARAKESAKETIKDAGEALSRLAKPSSMVSGRVICPFAANGTPDCKMGADKLCQSKGYLEGKSLNTDSAESCSAKVFIPGRQRKPGDCRTDNYVTAALCQ